MSSKKAILLIGPRQVGKTTLLKEVINRQSHLFFTGDDPNTRQLLDTPNFSQIRRIVGESKLIFIDEAQRINNIGLTLKLITDQMPNVQLLISGSSALELNNQITETLTGRKWEYNLLPISWEELEKHIGYTEATAQLETRMLYGFYPETINQQGHEKTVLKELTNSYLYKDILAIATIKKPAILEKLLTALALQIGSEVNSNELSKLLGIDKKTVETYIHVLEQAYIIFSLPAYSKNVRNEIKRGRKIYFYDVGIRNAVIGNFSPLDLRNDKGGLWENFLIAERLKQHTYKNTFVKMYFWRTTQQQEVDLVEIHGEKIIGFEFKWKANSNTKLSKTFTSNYDVEQQVVDIDNYMDFVVMK
jgi:hypothetical protein